MLCCVLLELNYQLSNQLLGFSQEEEEKEKTGGDVRNLIPNIPGDPIRKLSGTWLTVNLRILGGVVANY